LSLKRKRDFRDLNPIAILMHRKDFLTLTAVGLLTTPMITSLQSLEKLSNSFTSTKRMPVLFLGHGSPMNAIEENEFVRGFRKQGESLEKPNAILVISAHWETRGTQVTAMDNPRIIYDFGGFPKELYEVKYPAPGHPELAREISSLVQPKDTVTLDERWGLDHGSWSVVKHLFPNADVPVIQLSLDQRLSPQQHYDLAHQLIKLRDKGILIIGSGNMVHNLGLVAWNKLYEDYAYDWAIEADHKMKTWIKNSDHQSLIDFKKQGKAFDLAIPTPEHYLPLLYTLALKDDNEDVVLFNDKPLGGSLTMTSMKFG
jgi:4,5-DOPA dioxygenase extradiol